MTESHQLPPNPAAAGAIMGGATYVLFGLQPALQNFIRNPKNVDSILSSIDRQKKTIFASS